MIIVRIHIYTVWSVPYRSTAIIDQFCCFLLTVYEILRVAETGLKVLLA